MNHEIETNGFGFVRGLLDPAARGELIEALGPVNGAGRRGLLGIPTVATLARAERVLACVRPHLAAEPVAVRTIFFDKSPDANWLVPWHQDLTIAVRQAAEASGFGPWSIKEGIPHVQPPMALLEQMVTVRIHLDDADEDNGALRVLPGSHREGRLSAARIQEVRAEREETLCAASAGDALLMRPLLLHASGRSTNPRRRRVLHLEYAGFSLPAPLKWHEGA